MKERMKNDINVKGSGEMKRYGREKGWISVNVKLKKNIKNNYKKMERKKIIT